LIIRNWRKKMCDCPKDCKDCPYSTCYFDDMFYDEDEEVLSCHLCSCIIGEEVRYGYEMAPGEHICDVCAGDYDEEEKCNT